MKTTIHTPEPPSEETYREYVSALLDENDDDVARLRALALRCWDLPSKVPCPECRALVELPDLANHIRRRQEKLRERRKKIDGLANYRAQLHDVERRLASAEHALENVMLKGGYAEAHQGEVTRLTHAVSLARSSLSHAKSDLHVGPESPVRPLYDAMDAILAAEAKSAKSGKPKKPAAEPATTEAT